ncbi:helix-turn-helix domain-containing protein [Bacillus gaemokensis]|uniref:DNA-binding protein n=1 Tax=Bacillus gaemokensis TaxID=574375 RepID=A0A073KDT1_9BACI|nr:XRE family transcriptional regulator [Bacillus gaemokensis]KEK24617.1 DNA-binding protein [Bacillus gaemokensis]KYG39501.1 DNA-binding protein [Bacillus gaemokensis]
MDDNIGRKIKALRLEKRMTLKQVSEKTNLSISFISQVERSKSSITLESLKKISEALHVSPSCFFPDTKKKAKSLVRRGAQNEEHVNYSKFVYTNLSGNVSNPHFEPILVTLHSGEEKGNPYSHTGQEFVFVLEGALTIMLESEEYELHPGDSIHLESSTPHNWFNHTEKPAKFLFVSSTPMFSKQ